MQSPSRATTQMRPYGRRGWRSEARDPEGGRTSARSRSRPSALPIRARSRNPDGTGLSGRSAVSRRSPMGTHHWLRVASCISSRKASVATTRGLCRGSLTVHLAQDVLLDLAHGVTRQLVDDVHTLGNLEVRNLRLE